jgi:hypothetical protein
LTTSPLDEFGECLPDDARVVADGRSSISNVKWQEKSVDDERKVHPLPRQRYHERESFEKALKESFQHLHKDAVSASRQKALPYQNNDNIDLLSVFKILPSSFRAHEVNRIFQHSTPHTSLQDLVPVRFCLIPGSITSINLRWEFQTGIKGRDLCGQYPHLRTPIIRNPIEESPQIPWNYQ